MCNLSGPVPVPVPLLARCARVRGPSSVCPGSCLSGVAWLCNLMLECRSKSFYLFVTIMCEPWRVGVAFCIHRPYRYNYHSIVQCVVSECMGGRKGVRPPGRTRIMLVRMPTSVLTFGCPSAGQSTAFKGPVPLARPGEKRKQACPRDNKGRIEKVGRRKADWSFKSFSHCCTFTRLRCVTLCVNTD